MNGWGALIGAGIGLLRGAYTHSSDLKKMKRHRDRMKERAERLDKDFGEMAQAQNASYLRSLRGALAQQRVGSGSAGIATLRNQAEATAQGLADMSIGRRKVYLDMQQERKDAYEEARDAVKDMRAFDSHLDYGLEYGAKGAAIGATSGQAAAGDKGAANWEADSKDKEKEMQEEMKKVNASDEAKLEGLAEGGGSFFEDAGGLDAPTTTSSAVSKSTSSAAPVGAASAALTSQSSPDGVEQADGQQTQQAAATGTKGLNTGFQLTPPMQGGDYSENDRRLMRLRRVRSGGYMDTTRASDRWPAGY